MQKIFNFYSDWLIYLDTNKDYLIEIPYSDENIRFVDKTSNKKPWVKIGLSSKALSATLLRKLIGII